MTIKECKCVGPDGLAVVLIEVDKREIHIPDVGKLASYQER